MIMQKPEYFSMEESSAQELLNNYREYLLTLIPEFRNNHPLPTQAEVEIWKIDIILAGGST